MEKKPSKKQKFDHVHADHRSRMKQSYKAVGMNGFSEIEKLEFLLFFAIPFKDTNPLAHKLLDEFKSINGVINADYNVLSKIDGVGEHTAIFLNYLHELITYYCNHANDVTVLDSNTKAQSFCKNLFVGKQKEEMCVICLNSAKEVVNYNFIARGTVDSVYVSMKDVIRYVWDNNCEQVILAHNHPAGTPLPSDEDLSWTYAVMDKFKDSKIEVVDHIIVSPNGTYSMATTGYINDFEDRLEQIKAKHEADRRRLSAIHNIKK